MSRFALLSASIACLLASTTLADAAATLTLAPVSGPPTATLTATVKGFTPGRLVDVFFGTTAKCVIVAGATGGGSCSFGVPKEAQPATHWVTAAVRATSSGVQKPFLVRSDWPEAHGLNPYHDGFNRYENTISPANAHLLTAVWSVLGTVAVRNSPIVYRGRLYVGASDGKLHAFDATKGTVIAGFPKVLGGSISYSSPLAVSGIVYQVNADTVSTSKLFAFDIATGKAITGFPKSIAAQVLGSPIVVSGRLYVGASDGKVYGFDAKTGAVLAHYPIAVPGAPIIASTLGYSSGLILFGANDGKFYAYAATAGTQAWVMTATNLYDLSSPAVAAGTVHVVNPIDQRLHALDVTDGTSQWSAPFNMPGLTDGTPAIAAGRVYVCDSAPALRAIDLASGTQVWASSLGTGIGYMAPTVANGVVFAGTTRGVHAFEAATGKLLWSSARRVFANQSVPIVNGMIYVPSQAGGVVAHAIRGASAASVPPTARPAISELKRDLSSKP